MDSKEPVTKDHIFDSISGDSLALEKDMKVNELFGLRSNDIVIKGLFFPPKNSKNFYIFLQEVKRKIIKKILEIIIIF